MKLKITAFLVLLAVIITANSDSPRLSPWDAWRMAYTTFEQGENFRDKGEYLKARQAFDKALSYYNMVRKARPDWNQKVISERIADCEKESQRMKSLLGPAAEPAVDAKAAVRAAAEEAEAQVTAALRKELSLAKAELEELRRQNETRKNYESEISNLLRDQRLLRDRYALLEKRYRAQEEKLMLPDTKVRQLEDQLVAMRLQLDLARKENAAAKQNSSSAAAENSQLKKEKIKDENARRLLQSEVTALQKKLQFRERELSRAQQTLSSAEQQQKNTAARLTENSKTITALNNELNQLRDKYREKLAASGAGETANKKLLEENKKLQDANTSLQQSSRENAEKLLRLQRDVETLRQQLSAESRKAATAQEENKAALLRSQRIEKELEREKANTGILNRELDSMRQTSGNHTAELKRLNTENSELKKRLKFRDSEDFKNLTAARSERKKLEEKLYKLQENLTAAQTQLKLADEKYTALDKASEELKSENRKLHAQRISYESQLKNLTGVSANSRELALKYEELQKNFNALQAENRQNKVAAEAAKPREAELERIKLRLAELDGLKQQLRREQSFNEQLNAVKNRMERELRQLRPAGEENARLKARLSDFQMLQKEVERLRRLNRELAAAQNLSVQVADLKMEVAKLAPEAAEAAKLRKQNQELVQGKLLWESESSKMKLRLAVLEQKEAEIKKLQKEIETRDNSLRTAENSITQLNEEKRLLSLKAEELKDLKQKSRLLVNDQAKTLEQLRKAEEKIRLLNAELSTAVLIQDELRKAQQNLLGARQELQGAQKQLKGTQQELQGARQKLKGTYSAQQAANLEKHMLELRKENALLKSVNAKSVAYEQDLAAVRLANTRLRQELEKLRPLQGELTRINQTLAKRSGELEQFKKQNQILLKSAAAAETMVDENRTIRKLNSDLANRSLKAESELASLKAELANYNRLKTEVERLRRLNTELADAKRFEGELAQAKLTISRLEQMKDELSRQRKLNEELTQIRTKLEKELENRPMPAFAPVDYTPAGAPSKPLGKAEDYISLGKIAERDEKYDLAVWNYRTALKLAPDSAEAAELLGKVLLSRGDFADAAPMLSRARNSKPDSLELALDTAYAYIGLKRYGNAEAVVAPLLKRDKENPQLQIAAALIAAGNGEHAKAAGYLRLAAARLPNDPFPRMELARLLYNTDASRVFEAVKLYEEARRLGASPDLELEPKLANLLNKRRNLNNFLTNAAAEAARSKDWNSVIWYNKQLIELDREPEKYRPRLAFAQYKKGSSGAALETLSMGTPTPLSLLVKAFIHQMRSEKREAIQAVNQAKALNNNKLIELPADWSEFIIDFRRSGGVLTDFAK